MTGLFLVVVFDRSEERTIEDWLKEHLNNNGRAIYPCVDGPLIIFEKRDGELKRLETEEEYAFPPMLY